MPGTDTIQAKIQIEISKLSTSISSLVNTFRKLKNPLVESRQKVPQATNQLDKISEQTEAATHQMLDMVEKITKREEEIIGFLQKFKEYAERGNSGDIVSQVDGVVQRANTNLNDAYTIMDALQFQDITNQQMDHAASLLEEVETKLHCILAELGTSDAKISMPAMEQKRRAYDPHADLFDKKTNQADIDSLFDESKN